MRKFVSCISLPLMASCVLMGCKEKTLVNPPEEAKATSVLQTLLPVSDPNNLGGWVLNQEVSDEFEGQELDRSKWFVEGENGQYYIWKGRAPSQFAPHNVRVENGMLKLRSQWEPDYEFALSEGHEGNTYGVHEGKTIPVTTAAVVGKKRFLNGYMEVRSKAGDAAMTSSFWAIGYQSELDVYEQMGRPKLKGDIMEDTLKASIHDWAPPAVRPTRKFGHKTQLPFRVADEFHVYGVEWGEDYLKFFLDGKLVHEVTQAEVGKDWVLTNPMEIWLDSEIFVWLGLPHEEELPVDYEIDYVRVWQKPNENLLDRAFFGFEGPILFENEERPLDLVPESSVVNHYQKFWQISDQDKSHAEIVRHDRFASGTRSLKFSLPGTLNAGEVAVTAPEGALRLPAGDYTLSGKVWLAPGSQVDKLRVSLEGADARLAPIDLSGLPQGEWVTIEQSFKKSSAPSNKEIMKISILGDDISGAKSTLFLDDLVIKR